MMGKKGKKKNRKKKHDNAGSAYNENEERKENETSEQAKKEDWDDELQKNEKYPGTSERTETETIGQDHSTTSSLQTSNHQENQTIEGAVAVSSEEQFGLNQSANSLQAQTKDHEKTNSKENFNENDKDLELLLSHLSILLKRAKHGTIGIVVSELQSRVNVKSLSPTAIEKSFQWVIEQTFSVEKGQLLFLCAVLGYIISQQQTNFSLLPQNIKTKQACDKLLDNLATCAKKGFVIPDNCLHWLWRCAFTLVQSSSKPGWLTLAAYFHFYFGMKNILYVNMQPGEYTDVDFYKFLSLTVFGVPSVKKVYPHDLKELFQPFLRRILQCAPSDDVLFQMFQNTDLYRFFPSRYERENFFITFYLDNLGSSTGDLGDKLQSLIKIPEDVRNKMSGVIYGNVQQFINTVPELSSDDMEVICRLVSHNFTDENVLYLLRNLLKSRSETRHNMIFQLLSDKKFEKKWEKISLNEKVKICTSWVENSNFSGKNCGGIKTTFEAVDILISCTSVSSNPRLIQELCKNVLHLLQRRSEDVSPIIEEFEEFENHSHQVQECLLLLLEGKLQANPSLLGDKKVLNQFGTSRCQTHLMNCVLNELKIPKQEHNKEKVFTEMLKFCDVWMMLVDAEAESIAEHNTFKTGAGIWKDMEIFIMKEEVSVTLLPEIKKYQNEISHIFAGLHSPKGEDHENLRHRCISKINELVSIEEDVRNKLDLLEAAFKFAGKVLSGCGVIPTEIIKRKNDLRTMKMKELNEEFWGPHMPLLKRLASLYPLMQSASFINISKIYVQENDPLECVTFEVTKIDIDQLIILFEALATDGISQFEAEWYQVLHNPDMQTVRGLKVLLGDIDSNTMIDEFSHLEKYFGQQLPQQVKNYIEDSLKFSRIMAEVEHIIALLESFGIIDSAQNVLVPILTSFMDDFPTDEEIVVSDLHDPLSVVENLISRYDLKKNDEVVVQLIQSHELIKFLNEIVDEDIRILIDAVEEHSDQSVSASLVSDLIQIHSSLAPVLKICDTASDHGVLMTLVNELEKQPMLSVKIRQCSVYVHSLKSLYKNVANREEMTKEIIMNCLSKGVFDISLDENGICQITMKYEKDRNNLTEKSMSELHDLRSRAHLILSAVKKPETATHNGEEPKQEINYADFIEQVNILSEIEQTILNLRISGSIVYQYAQDWEEMKETEDLQELANALHEELEAWEKSLREARKKYYFLNYYWSDQLCILYNFLINSTPTKINFESVLTLIHFVDPTVNEQRLREYKNVHLAPPPSSHQKTPDQIFAIVGDGLNEIFADTRPVLRNILDDVFPTFQPVKFKASVTKGELYVAVLDEESPLTVNVMMTLYENTTNGYPEPYQVIFCGPHTTWEEIQIFLQRCFYQTTYLPRESLFCLANVELLTNEIQFELIDYIKKQNTEDLDYQLAIICRGGDYHPIVQEFSKFQHSISGMTYSEISQRFRSSWPDIKFVTSTLPGLGKTEFIREEGLEKRMNVVTFPISGQLDQSKIIGRLQQLDLKDFQCLHFDIGEVDDPILLDTFLFQLIVTGMASFGTQRYSLQNTHVYIEVANSLNDRLRNSLVVAKCFTNFEVEWRNYDDLEVSSKINSDIQVVCQYLNALERGQLENEDIHFTATGEKKLQPLSGNRCRDLLRKYYSTNADTTFTALNTFLGLLANQLRKFSRSAFFEVENLKLMLEEKAFDVRRKLLTALLEVSKDFATRSLKTCSSSHQYEALTQTMETSAQRMVQRVEGMIRWEESNHLLIVFHGEDSQTIAAFYRDKNRVPLSVSELLKSQIVKDRSKELDDFQKMSHEELHERLERIARTNPRNEEREETTGRQFSGYALTPDNMLKMILIILRVRANVPIIIMGETGCGKTSLVEYLAETCEIPFKIYNIHAGRSEDEIKNFVGEQNNEARKAKGQRWVFLDEINTCHHLGMINEIMCHHTLQGQPLSKKLVLLAACNPYKLRPEENATTAGLEGKNVTDEYSELVYRVHQLPEAMVDYVWDYGSLTPQDEKKYIERMVQKLPSDCQRVLVDLLAESQAFIREAERNHFCVSLRDVRRCIVLVEWFMKTIGKRAKVMNGRPNETRSVPVHLKKYKDLTQRYNGKPEFKSIVLALAHCYLSRLQTEELREEYIKKMAQQFPLVANEDEFSAIIRMEQEDYLDRMELPPGTARNAALRENVFVMLVSILNRIPVFVVGKPGCSKSLAIQLIKSNLRGEDSIDPFFKTLPHLYVVSYQGSESSTSEGIEEIFEKASNYKNQDANVLPVVLLDEVGLAENSSNNPLKVLHSILEPGKGELPQVAVVGISNWALDAAKMNRAIHLSRPEPTVKDLEETAISLYHADGERQVDATTRNVLANIADAYHEYQSEQGHRNFHGLRDYYSLVKSLRNGTFDDYKINIALQRNFGGIPVESSKIQEIFMDKFLVGEKYVRIPVATLIQENLDDLKARHLMLITNGDSAIGILKQNFSQSEKETITIFGSRFEEDMSDDYNYRMLSRIILCMERECILILRDLECIYGSLYDMLNQNYSVVGKRKNCRVALGANSNPMCYVNDGFRCIVLVDHDKVDFSDPPFLNRFEKQLLRFSDVLNEDQQEIIEELESWVEQMSCVEDLDEQFKKSDMFMGFHEDTLPSLVLLHSKDTDDCGVILKKCKDDLMWIATTDGVLRAQKCEFMQENPQELKMLVEDYFEKPIHHGLSSFIECVVRDQQLTYTRESEFGSKTVVMTYATVHSDISKYLDPTIATYQLERLGSYKSEKQLEDRIHNFFSSDKDLLVFQCKPELDDKHMLLARSIIEDKRKSYVEEYQESNSMKRRKHVCIIVHVRRVVREETTGWQFNFLSGWKQVFLDALDVPSIGVSEMRNESIENLFSSSVWSFQGFAAKCILWCFNCIKYSQSERRRETILKIAKNLFASEKVTTAIQKLVLRNVDSIDDDTFEETWQVKVACDIELLLNSSTVSSAMEQYLSFLIRQPLAKIVYFLERENAWPPHVLSTHEDTIDYEDIWCDLLLNSTILNIVEIPESHGAETYFVDGVHLNLRVPFSQVIFHDADSARGPIMKEYAKAMRNESNFDDSDRLKADARLEHLRQYSKILRKLAPCIHVVSKNCMSSYMADVFELLSADFYSKINSQQCISFCMCAFLSFAKQWLPIEDNDPHQFYALLHLFAWNSSDEINCLLELVDSCCQELMQPKYLEKMTREFFLENHHVLPFSETDPIDERFDVLRTKTKSSGREYKDRESNDYDSSDSDSSDSDDSDSSDSDDSEDEEDDDDEEEEDCFEDILVTEICEKLFPSKRTVEKNGGLDLWIENSSHLLSLASKVSNETPPAYHFLRLCVDYAEMVVQESGKCEDYLYVLNTIGRELEPEYLDDESSFQKIKEKVIDPVENYLMGEEENHAILQIFLAQFYNRFPEANAETKSARAIIEHVLSLRGEEVLIMTSVIYRLLFAEEDRSSGIFIDIILDQKVGEKQSNLKDIDEVFKERFAVGQIHHDSYPAVMICDLIHFIQNFDKYFNIKQLASSDSKLLRCFRSATNFVTGSDDNIGLVLLSSVAFLRAFYSMLSKNRSILTGETPYSHVMNEINSLLAGGGARRSSLQIFFLKQLYRDNMTMFDLRKLCFESVNLPVIRNQMEQCKIVNKVELVSVFRLDEYEEVKAAFSLLTQKNEEEMSNVMKKCEKSANHRLALLGILINEFFVKKAVGNLSDKEEHLANWFRKNSKDLPSVMKELLVRIVGHKSFRHQGLQISLESSTYEIDIALLILHVSCVVASHDEGENSPLVQYFSNPKNCHVLAQGEDRKRRVFQQFTLCNESTESKEWEECTVNMSASVYRALDMIVYACFYAGIATGISSSEDVLPLLPANKQGSPSRATCKDSADFCFNRVKDDLRCLQTILSCDSRTAVDVMHLVVEECTELIRGKTSSDGNFGTRRECIEWENRFTNVAEEILPKALGSARQLKETRMDFEGEKRSLIEKQIMELDEYPSDHEQQNEELKRLFRVTKQPSFTELRSIYLNRFNDFQEHRVLAVLLSKFHELPYLACLYPLIRWSRLVSSKLTNRISRKEAQSKVIYDFIDGRLLRQEESNDEGTELREIFNDFKVAWNKVREFVNQNIDPDQEEMPYLTEESYIGYCLTEGDFSIYLQTAIKILQSIQNNILDEITLASARTRHAARLRLLKKNKNRNAITSVSLQEAKEKDIIKFNWSDEFLKYVQDPNYGLGEDTDYDFDKIEEELVIEIVAGKCHLTESVNTFIFAKELFHSSAKVLTKIREFCPQSQSLPEEICQGLNSLKESRKQDARTLLQHIEIVIYLLNIESIPADDIKKITLVKFVEMWETKLPSPFPIDLLPEPKASIQLTHIAALYEALEDLLADGAIEGLPRQYNVKLTKDTEKILNSLVDNRNKSLKLKLFLKALRRFVFRYLSAEKFLPESHTPLRSCLMEPSLWSPEEAPSADVIPGELRLENIYAIMKHLDQELKEHSSARLNQESRETGLGIRRRPKRRVIAKFSR